MKDTGFVSSRAIRRTIAGAGALALVASALAQQAATSDLGATPPAASLPRVEFVFEARVTLSPATVLGETAMGRRQYIPITGGTVAGPKFKGQVVPGGWDYQLRTAGGCGTISADYFWRAEDGAVIHILNEGMMCPGGAQGERTWLHPRFEAPKGPHEWLTRGSFVASLEPDRPATPPAPGSAPAMGAIRIKFYQIK